MGGLSKFGVRQVHDKVEANYVNELVVYKLAKDSVLQPSEIEFGDVFPALVEFVKLKRANFTGDKKEVKAFFKLFRGQPQVHFKYGQKYYVFDLAVRSEVERQYARQFNFDEGRVPRRE